MERALACVLATLSCGCLMPNPAYLDGEAGSGGEMESTSAGSDAGTAGGTSDDSATVETSTGSGATSGTSSSSTGSPGTGTGTEGGMVDLGQACPDDDALSVCLLFDVDDPSAVLDESPHSNAVAVEGGGLVDSPWVTAFAFDADTRVDVDCPEACIGGEQVSFEAWVWVDEAPEQRSGILDQSGRLGAFVTSGLQLRCNSQGGAADGGVIPLKTWVHVACVADGETLRVFVGGEVVSERVINPLTPVGQPTLVLGNDSPSYGEPLLGALDRVRVWDTALSAEEVAEAAIP